MGIKVGLQAIYCYSSAREVKQIANPGGHLVLFYGAFGDPCLFS